MRFSQLKADNISALKRQMAEKEQVKRLKKLEDDSYAQIIRKEVASGVEKDRRKQLDYKS